MAGEVIPDDNIPALVRRLRFFADRNDQEQAAQRLDELAYYCELHPTFVASQAVPALVGLLSCEGATHATVGAAASTLARLSGHNPSMQAALGAVGVIPTLVRLLRRPGPPDAPFRPAAVEALDHLIKGGRTNNEARLAACGGLAALLDCVRDSSCAELREAAIAALSALQEEDNKRWVLDQGVVPIIVAQLRRPGTRRTQYVATTLLHNLCIAGQPFKRAVADAGGIPPIAALLQCPDGPAGPEDELGVDIRESAADAMCTLCYANLDNCVAIMLADAVPALVALLRHPTHEALRNTAVGALSNLCAHPAGAFAMVEAGCCITDLGPLVESSNPEARRAANALVRPLASASLLHGLAEATGGRPETAGAARRERPAAAAAVGSGPAAAAGGGGAAAAARPAAGGAAAAARPAAAAAAVAPPAASAAAAAAAPPAAPAAGLGGGRQRRMCAAEGCDNTHHLKRCQGCQVARFCSVECQRRAWPTHKPECRRLAAERQQQQP